MEQIHKFEILLLEQYNKLPHLPEGFRKWLAENVWWIVLIGVAVSAFTILGIISILAFVVLGFGVGGAALGIPGLGAGVAAIAGVVLLFALVSLAMYIAVAVLLGMAINPLRKLQKRGWDLLFIVALVNLAFAVLSGVVNLNIISLLIGVFWAAVGAYFLFEVRDYFVANKAGAKQVEAKVKS